MDAPSPAELATADYFIYVTQVYFCAMYAVVLWDWIISLPREYRFVWRTHWTPVKIAYLFCRYWVITVVPYLLYCFVVDHPRATCERIYKIPVALAMWNQVGSESVLLIRTYAFFSRNVYVLMFLLSALSGMVAYQLYVDTTQMLLLPFYKPPFDKGPCLPMSKPHSAHLLGFFIAPLLFDTMITSMTVWKAINIRRRNGGPNSRLIQTFLREGVFYYILISIANLINGIFYLQPRQVISAINIPLSVMLGPVLACRLILDLRERGSETVSHSEGTGIAAFTTKSMTQHGSPYTPPGHRSKGSRYRTRGVVSTISSNVVLTTLGSIHPDHMDLDLEQDVVEMEDIRLGLGMDLGNLSTAVGGDDGEPLPEDEGRRFGRHRCSPAPAYDSLEMGFRPGGRRSSTPSIEESNHSIVRGIRVDVEQATSTM
ncbi:hypothetical protein M413DRAFT_22112 [Hebeloma cylindrosporum]|uniref:DUF6533 domain-containing protein n=1 Tax=Hebeloma cylindrosporum TaxID=76867 RepID=A0A0C3CFB7_HEBCY|nr:hypothetical protein M413DRAFT_22112 [Hebeloma cylindrosporum h7]